MKKSIYLKAKRAAAALILPLALLSLAFPVFAAGSAQVYVTISNGSLCTARQKVEVTDVDADGALTVSDALYLAHEAAYPGGAAAGYAASVTDYGISLDKLWGVENGGSYGYFINNASAMSLSDPVKDGDHIAAFIYTDTNSWSDTYCYFNTDAVSAGVGEPFTLTLLAIGYDADFNQVTNPVAGATITIDGAATAIKTGADGKATISIDAAKVGVISAVSDTAILVPPVCAASIGAAAPQTSDIGAVSAVILASSALSAAVLLRGRRRNEK